MDEHNCLAVMVGRGALITPWIFESWRTGQELLPTTEERVDIYRQFVGHMKVTIYHTNTSLNVIIESMNTNSAVISIYTHSILLPLEVT